MNKKFSVTLIILILLILVSAGKSMAEEENALEDNANLSQLHLEYSGISPNFDKDITEYYFIASNEIDNIEVTAIPENSGATVNITGNENIQYGKNTILIEVTSQDNTQTKTYTINLTKTDRVETANANLETLAVRQGMLIPEFDNNTTKYTVDISNNIYYVDLLAIPQSENATINITGNNEIEVGDNKIQVVVRAEDDITEKVYEITAHRRTPEEQLQHEEETKIQAERLSLILEGENANSQMKNLNKENNIVPIIIGLGIIGLVSIWELFGRKDGKK